MTIEDVEAMLVERYDMRDRLIARIAELEALPTRTLEEDGELLQSKQGLPLVLQDIIDMNNFIEYLRSLEGGN